MECRSREMKVIAYPAYSNREINPYTSLLYETMALDYGIEITEFRHSTALLGSYDILHVHWPESMLIRQKNVFKAYFYIFKFVFIVLLSKLRGAKLIWTIHNLKSHENTFPRLRRYFYQWFVRSVDGAIVLSNSTLDLVATHYPEILQKPLVVTPHGHYRSVYTNTMSRQQARQQLMLDEQELVLLYVCQIRRYKNVPHLIRTFRELSDRHIRLIVAGNPDSNELRQEVQEARLDDERIQLHLQSIKSDDMQVFMNAADMVVLPYQEILNSGSAILALSFNKPILVPEKGSMGELHKIVGSDWVYTYRDVLTSEDLIKAIHSYIPENRLEKAPLDALDWTRIAHQTIQLYQQVLYGDRIAQCERIISKGAQHSASQHSD